MDDTTLIQISDIQNITSISDNIEVDQLSSFLFNAQNIYVLPLVGQALYDAMIAEIIAGTGSTYTSLIENYVAYALAYATFHSFLPFGHIKVHKKGVVLQTSDNSASASPEEFALLSGRVESTMRFYLKKLKDYLDDNKDIYTLYKSTDTASTPQNSSSIFLGFA